MAGMGRAAAHSRGMERTGDRRQRLPAHVPANYHWPKLKLVVNNPAPEQPETVGVG